MFRSRPSPLSFPHSLPNRAGFLHLSKHHPSTFMPRSHMWKKETHGTCLSEFGFLHLTRSSPVPSIFPQLTVTRKKKRFQGEAKPEVFITDLNKERRLWKVVMSGGKAQSKWELHEFVHNSLPCGAGDHAQVLMCVRLLLRTKLHSQVQKIHAP